MNQSFFAQPAIGRRLLLSILFLSSMGILNAQIVNGSFEGPTGSAPPPGWSNCGGSPDTQILNGSGNGIFGINTVPADGNTYIGMVTTNNQAYQEALGQPTTLSAGTSYSGSIELFASSGHTSWNGNGRLRIYGGSSCTVRNELLWDSGTITNYLVWNNFPISFSPTMNHTYITLVNYMNNGTGTMDYFCMDDFRLSNLLPIELNAFWGASHGETSLIEWETAPSLAEQSFEVTWTDDLENAPVFKSIGNVQAANGQEGFSFQHNAPSPGDNFYRLKSIHENGEFSFSEVVKVVHEENHLVQVYPNPGSGRLNLDLNLYHQEMVKIQVTSMDGKLAYQNSEKLGTGRHTLALELENVLSKGIFVLQVRIGEKSYHQRLSIVH